MKSFKYLFLLILAISMQTQILHAQEEESSDAPKVIKRNIGGPRMGLTYVVQNTELSKKLAEKNIGSVISQFGWHFESVVSPAIGGPSLVFEFVPLIAGVEYGTLIPSANALIGIRFENGFEFGMGPNALIGGDNVFNTSLVIAVGKTFNYGPVSLPFNLAFSTSPAGQRISFIFGYAIN